MKDERHKWIAIDVSTGFSSKVLLILRSQRDSHQGYTVIILIISLEALANVSC